MSYTKSCLRTHQSPVYVSCNSKWTPLTAQDWICFLIFPLHICFQSAWPVHPTPSPCDLVFLPAWQLACHVWDLVLSWSIFPWMRLKSEISWKILWPAEIQGVSWTMPQITLFFFYMFLFLLHWWGDSSLLKYYPKCVCLTWSLPLFLPPPTICW